MLKLRELDTRIVAFGLEFAELSRADETMRSLLPIPGIGVTSAPRSSTSET
jgi:hypothetical protein